MREVYFIYIMFIAIFLGGVILGVSVTALSIHNDLEKAHDVINDYRLELLQCQYPTAFCEKGDYYWRDGTCSTFEEKQELNGLIIVESGIDTIDSKGRCIKNSQVVNCSNGNQFLEEVRE